MQCRKDDQFSKKILECIEDSEARIRCEAERQFLNKLEGVSKI